jgi:hypothetical protein
MIRPALRRHDTRRERLTHLISLDNDAAICGGDGCSCCFMSAALLLIVLLSSINTSSNDDADISTTNTFDNVAPHFQHPLRQ